MSRIDVCSEIVRRIREANADERKSFRLVTSEDLYRKLASDIVASEEELNQLIKVLVEAHYLLCFKIVEPDEARQVDGIYAYIGADLPLLAALRQWADRYLETAYEQHFYRRKHASGILRELVPDARSYNCTDLGRALNIASMILQYERLLASNFGEYSENWKFKQLRPLMENVLVTPAEWLAYELQGQEPYKRFGTEVAPVDVLPVRDAPTLSPEMAGLLQDARHELAGSAEPARQGSARSEPGRDAGAASARDVAASSDADLDGGLEVRIEDGADADPAMDFDAEPDMGPVPVSAASPGEWGRLAPEAEAAAPVRNQAHRRAVDQARPEDLQAIQQSSGWARAVQQYGVQFLLRIHLRKCEFELVRSLIRSDRIGAEEDLRFIRDSLRKMQGRLDQDPLLRQSQTAMVELKRTTQIRLNRLHLARTASGAESAASV